MKEKININVIAVNGIIAALYIVLSLLSGPFAFAGGVFQIRISEALNLLVFFNPFYIIGVSVGCLITNIFSSYGFIDILIGTSATILSDGVIILISKTIKNLFSSALSVVLINSFLVPFTFMVADKSLWRIEIYFLNVMWVAIGEVISCVILGYTIFMVVFKKYKKFGKLLGFTQNQDYKW